VGHPIVVRVLGLLARGGAGGDDGIGMDADQARRFEDAAAFSDVCRIARTLSWGQWARYDRVSCAR
jgi:hypothetical protein